MKMNYFYKAQTEQFSFLRIPKILVTGKQFSSLSLTSKILYGLLLDRMDVAEKNQWTDEKGRVFIYYPISDMQKDMNISKRKTIECMNELEKIGLIEKKRQGSGLPNQIYIRNFIDKNIEKNIEEEKQRCRICTSEQERKERKSLE